MFKIIPLMFFVLNAIVCEAHQFQEPDSSKHKRVRFSPLPVIYFRPKHNLELGKSEERSQPKYVSI